MRKNARRVVVPGFALAAAAAAALAFPPSAAAEEALSGSCATTLQGARAQGLAIDLGAPLDVPGKLTVGLDSAAAGPRQERNAPLLSLPVGDTLRTVGAGKVPAVSSVCAATQGAVNAVGDKTQSVLGGKSAPRNPPAHPNPPGEPAPRPTDPTNPTATAPTAPAAGSQPGSGQTGQAVDSSGGGGTISGIVIDGAFLPGNFAAPVIVPIVPPGMAPNLSQGDEVPPVVTADRSGTAQALPSSGPPARLPLLLAVLTLAVVAAALIRLWVRRKPA